MIPSYDFSLHPNSQIHIPANSNSHQHSFHNFCKEELPPLSPLTAKTLPHSNKTSTPRKLNQFMNEIFSDKILDFETIEKKNKSGSKNPNLLEQFFGEHSNDFAINSPFFKRKDHHFIGEPLKNKLIFEPNVSRQLDFHEIPHKGPLNPVLSGFTYPGFERKEAQNDNKPALPIENSTKIQGFPTEPKKKDLEKLYQTPEKEKKNEISTASSEMKSCSPHGKTKKSKSSEKKSPKTKKISLSSQNSTEHNGCKCKKSKCLKLYCECFSNGLMCNDNCNCNNCSNKTCEDNLERDVALQALIAKYPNIPIIKSGGLMKNSDEQLQKMKKNNAISPINEKLKKGCNCKKSQCQKKYCECYEAGLKCEAHCKCEECKNTVDNKKKIEENEMKNKMGNNKDNLMEKEEAPLRKKRKME